MNTLIVGFNKAAILDHVTYPCLFIDDGDLIDRLDLPKRRAVTVFDVTKHAFNPLKGMDYRKAREFWDVLKAAFPEGEHTLTKAAAELQILEALTQKPRNLATLIPNTKDTAYAHQMLRKLLLSPVLERILTQPTNVSFKGIVIARLNRAELTDFECFVIANLLISQYQGQVIIPDFGFYACPSHVSLIRQKRLIAGINSFAEVPKLRNNLILMDRKVGSQTTPEDAELLATFAGLVPNTNAYNDFIFRCLTPHCA